MYDRIKLAQTNVTDLLNNISTWANQPLYERKDGKKENLLGLEDRTERIQKRKELVQTCSNDMQRILKENYTLFLNMPFEEEKAPEPEEVSEVESPEKSPEEQKGRGKDFWNISIFLTVKK